MSIGEDYLLGCDGYRAILIECNSIPEELKCKQVNWKSRKNFEPAKAEGDYPNIFKNVNDAVIALKYNDTFKTDDIKKAWFSENKDTEKYDNSTIVKFTLGDIRYAFNAIFIETVFDVLSGIDQVKVHWNDTNISPIILHAGNVKMMILPVRCKD